MYILYTWFYLSLKIDLHKETLYAFHSLTFFIFSHYSHFLQCNGCNVICYNEQNDHIIGKNIYIVYSFPYKQFEE